MKIDRSFIDQVASNHRDAAVYKGVITMARELDMAVGAEGVETANQYDHLITFGCDVFQGYHFATPMRFAELVGWISENLTKKSRTDH